MNLSYLMFNKSTSKKYLSTLINGSGLKKNNLKIKMSLY